MGQIPQFHCSRHCLDQFEFNGGDVEEPGVTGGELGWGIEFAKPAEDTAEKGHEGLNRLEGVPLQGASDLVFAAAAVEFFQCVELGRGPLLNAVCFAFCFLTDSRGTFA